MPTPTPFGASASKRELRDHVVSFRVPQSMVKSVESWLKSTGQPGSASQLFRGQLLRALEPRAVSGVFKDSFVDAVPDLGGCRR